MLEGEVSAADSARPDLSSHVLNGEMELHYLDFGRSQIRKGQLVVAPGDEFIYFGNKASYALAFWDSTMQGQRSGIRLIKKGGGVLYENKEIPFDYSKIE